MIIYHEINPEMLTAIPNDGLRCAEKGDKSEDSLIQTTDTFLDTHRPQLYQQLGVSRLRANYGYLTDGDAVIDITDGRRVSRDTFIAKSKQAILQIDADPTCCYVSQLDLYDIVKVLLDRDVDATAAAQTYWHSLQRLDTYQTGTADRIEAIITYDVPPDAIRILSRG